MVITAAFFDFKNCCLSDASEITPVILSPEHCIRKFTKAPVILKLLLTGRYHLVRILMPRFLIMLSRLN